MSSIPGCCTSQCYALIIPPLSGDCVAGLIWSTGNTGHTGWAELNMSPINFKTKHPVYEYKVDLFFLLWHSRKLRWNFRRPPPFFASKFSGTPLDQKNKISTFIFYFNTFSKFVWKFSKSPSFLCRNFRPPSFVGRSTLK